MPPTDLVAPTQRSVVSSLPQIVPHAKYDNIETISFLLLEILPPSYQSGPY